MGRLARSVEDMAEFCPNFAFLGEVAGTGVWSGQLQPLRTTDGVVELLDDMHHNRNIYTAWRGELRHLPRCAADHCHHVWQDALKIEELLRTFEARIEYAGGQEDPRCWVEGITRENGRHMWADGSICPFLSARSSWDWSRETVADFVGHVSIWLASWMVFQQTTTWIVGEHAATPGYHLTVIRPNEHCWCRSGKKYRKCHMRDDQFAYLRTGR
jgi:hypothetical protein